MSRARRRIVIAALGGAVLVLMGLGVAFGGQDEAAKKGAQGAEKAPKADSRGVVAANVRYYVDPESDAAQQERRWMTEGREADAASIRAISRRPGAQWFGEPDSYPTPVQDRVAGLTTQAAGAGTVPVLVIYSIPFRDCGSFSSGGSRSGAEYKRYVQRIARGIADRQALVILEPDATGHIADSCVTGARAQERVRLLREAIQTLKANPRTRVYLDAGNAGFIEPGAMAPLLRRSGISRADGFSVNVANFHTTSASLAHGRAIARRVGNKPFVVDTSRNGRGPWRSDDPQTWCNPPGRALGRPPTSNTGQPGVDAFLWIKGAGDSDGTCRSGPQAGQWWPDYALRLARAQAG